MFLKIKNIIFKIRRSKVTDYAALKDNYEDIMNKTDEKNESIVGVRTLCIMKKDCLFCWRKKVLHVRIQNFSSREVQVQNCFVLFCFFVIYLFYLYM